MKELLLKYGCNPNQSKARIYSKIGELPIEVLNGRPGYINFLDAFCSSQGKLPSLPVQCLPESGQRPDRKSVV